MIPYGKQLIDESDIKAVVEVLRHGMLTGGPKVAEFEEALAKKFGAQHAVVCSNGTAALHLACLALELGPEDTMVTSPNTFPATANAARYCGARALFSDINSETWNLDLESLEKTLASESIKAIFPVHYAGLPINMEELQTLARKYNCAVVEDACHAPGSSFRTSRGEISITGSAEFSDMVCFSFHPVKHIACGEGGAVLTNRSDLYEKLLQFRNHGIEFNPKKFINKSEGFTGPKPNPWYREQQSLGYNYRLTDIQCALGLSQLKKLDAFVQRRRNLMSQYQAKLEGFVRFQKEPQGTQNSFHLCTVLIDFQALGKTRLQLMEELKEQGVGTQVLYPPAHLHPYYGGTKGQFPKAEAFYDQCLSLPLYPSMTDEEQGTVIRAVKKALGAL